MKPTYSHPSRKADSCGPRLGIGSSGCPVFPFGVVSAPSYPTIRLVTPCATAHRGNLVRRTPSRQCTAVVAAHRVSCYPDGHHPPCIFGSLPRGGNGAAVAADQLNSGWLIPSRAGNTAGRAEYGAGRTVHPHVWGARCTVEAWDTEPTGSFPRAREHHVSPKTRAADVRVIPACAGERSTLDPW